MSLSEEQVKETLNPMLQSLQQGLGEDLVAAALFGSRARGDATPESDWDVLLIAHHLPERPLQRHFFLKTMLPETWRARLSILAKTPSEFEARVPSLYLDIALDAVVLFDPQGYLQDRLAKLREQIARLGLHRERINENWVWRWKATPPSGWAVTWEAVP